MSNSNYFPLSMFLEQWKPCTEELERQSSMPDRLDIRPIIFNSFASENENLQVHQFS